MNFKLVFFIAIAFILSTVAVTGQIMCMDNSDCANGFECIQGDCVRLVEICDDGIDNNFDGRIDMQDPDCKPVIVDEICDDGIDNDGDSLIDQEDPDCQKSANVPEFGLIGAGIALLAAGYVASRKRR